MAGALFVRGNFNNLASFLRAMKEPTIAQILDSYGQQGVSALAAYTPYLSGATASGWYYEVSSTEGSYIIQWSNSNVNKGVSIALILQYGHGTGTGGYVVGRDYINPALQPIFDKIAEQVWREVVDA